MKTMETLPTLKQLRHLVALADNRHFGKAAKACFVTQSTLSASLKELEDVLQAPLVDRTNRRVAFTPLGEATVERARRLLDEAQELVLAAQGERAPLTGTVRLGVIPTIGPFLLPRILPALRAAWPKLKLYLREDQTDPLLEQLHAGRLDVLLLALPYDCGNVETAPLFKDRFSLALRRDHPLARAKRVRSRGDRVRDPAAAAGGPLPARPRPLRLPHRRQGPCRRLRGAPACRRSCRWSTTASA